MRRGVTSVVLGDSFEGATRGDTPLEPPVRIFYCRGFAPAPHLVWGFAPDPDKLLIDRGFASAARGLLIDGGFASATRGLSIDGDLVPAARDLFIDRAFGPAACGRLIDRSFAPVACGLLIDGGFAPVGRAAVALRKVSGELNAARGGGA